MSTGTSDTINQIIGWSIYIAVGLVSNHFGRRLLRIKGYGGDYQKWLYVGGLNFLFCCVGGLIYAARLKDLGRNDGNDSPWR